MDSASPNTCRLLRVASDLDLRQTRLSPVCDLPLDAHREAAAVFTASEALASPSSSMLCDSHHGSLADFKEPRVADLDVRGDVWP
mmetsp:Transcript_133/g.173  ORF Transcript_133/g.173 Transcript_133/m.173 type:complete len:85 (-) Transcript_133:148-402(-)